MEDRHETSRGYSRAACVSLTATPSPTPTPAFILERADIPAHASARRYLQGHAVRSVHRIWGVRPNQMNEPIGFGLRSSGSPGRPDSLHKIQHSHRVPANPRPRCRPLAKASAALADEHGVDLVTPELADVVNGLNPHVVTDLDDRRAELPRALTGERKVRV
jgi:hypothetical protein